MILYNKQKFQSGGVMPMAQNLDTSSPDYSGILSADVAQEGYKPSSRSTSKSSSSTGSESKGLPSDKAYEQEVLAQLEYTMKNASSDVERKAAQKEWFNRKTQFANDSKAYETKYKKAETQVDKSGTLPAMYGNNVLVVDSTTNKPRIISKRELYTEAKTAAGAARFRIMNMKEAKDLRFHNKNYSGYTDMGRELNMILDNNAGLEEYKKVLSLGFDKLGYNSNDMRIDKDGVIRTRNKGKGNSNAIEYARNALIQSGVLNEKFVSGNSLMDTYRSIVNSSEDISFEDAQKLESQKGVELLDNLIGAKIKSDYITDKTFDESSTGSDRPKGTENRTPYHEFVYYGGRGNIAFSDVEKENYKEKAGGTESIATISADEISNSQAILRSGYKDVPIEERNMTNNRYIDAIVDDSDMAEARTLDGKKVGVDFLENAIPYPGAPYYLAQIPYIVNENGKLVPIPEALGNGAFKAVREITDAGDRLSKLSEEEQLKEVSKILKANGVKTNQKIQLVPSVVIKVVGDNTKSETVDSSKYFTTVKRGSAAYNELDASKDISGYFKANDEEEMSAGYIVAKISSLDALMATTSAPADLIGKYDKGTMHDIATVISPKSRFGAQTFNVVEDILNVDTTPDATALRKAEFAKGRNKAVGDGITSMFNAQNNK